MSEFIKHCEDLLKAPQRGMPKGTGVIKLKYLNELFDHWQRLDAESRTDYYGMVDLKKQLAAVTQELEQLKQSSVVMPEAMPHCIYSKVFRSLKAHGFVVGDCEIRDIYSAIRQALAEDKEKDSEPR